MINLFLGGFQGEKKERGRIEREGGWGGKKEKKTCKSLPCDLQVFSSE